MKIAELTKAMNSLNRQIKTILKDSGFDKYNELCPDEFDTNRKLDSDGYEVADLTADEWQLVYDYEQILDKLDMISDRLAYLAKPINYEGTLHLCDNGRYSCDYHEFTCGNYIEYQKYDADHECYYWAISRVEFNKDKGGYYIYGDSITQLDGLRVRFRW